MKELLDSLVSDGLTVRNLIVMAAITVLLLISIYTIKDFVKKRKPPAHVQKAICTGCGWQGKVSRYAGRCPQCNQPLGDRKAQPKTK